MAKPAHLRVVFSGVIGTVVAPLERWAFGINFPHEASTVANDDVVDNLIAEDYANAYGTNYQASMPSDVILTQVKHSLVNGAGHVELRPDGSYAQGVWNGSKAGVNAPQQVPLQQALCVSLMTHRSGATGRGRFYLPWPTQMIEAATKRWPAATAAGYAALARDFLSDLADIATFAPQVVSSKGYMTPVTGVRVGRKPDTMRSRSEDVPEEYQSVSFNWPA